MSSEEPTKNPAYSDGMDGILAQWQARRAPLRFAEGEALPPLDCDLGALRDKIVAPPEKLPTNRSDHARKSFDIAQELQGQSALLHLNALLIAHLRKRAQPPHAAALFHRIWAEEAPSLLNVMDLRWKVSSLTTFGDHGLTPVQRSTGLALSTLFGTMKLYESERLFSGVPADKSFTLQGRASGPLPLEMNGYSLSSGGLDVNMLARLWHEAEQDAVIRPLAHDMITRVTQDPRTVFRRLHTLRVRAERRKTSETPANSERKTIHIPVPAAALPANDTEPRWGLVMTTNAPKKRVLGWAAHHLAKGAARLHVFFDAPDPETTRHLAKNPRITVTQCDADYWRAVGKDRMNGHQLRQAFNATRAMTLLKNELDFIGHVDVDEFVMSDVPVAQLLAQTPPDMAAIRVIPSEALAPEDDGAPPQYFKKTPKSAGREAAVLSEIYPTFGDHLRAGFLSHVAGKIFTRTRLDNTRLAIHNLRTLGKDAENTIVSRDLWLAHCHAPSKREFLAKLTFRREKGSYRLPQNGGPRTIGQVIAYLEANETPEALDHLFEDLCRATPGLLSRLSKHGMLRRADLDLERKIKKTFGTV